jgi:2-polyprenyl-3-methyl-5-hydroxy-6-metoxy-1,4-benzoquinol methylase
LSLAPFVGPKENDGKISTNILGTLLNRISEKSQGTAALAEYDLSRIRKAYAEVDAYQPVYKLESRFSERSLSRIFSDRCEVLAQELGAAISKLPIMDVGCSMGYLSLYFAERGAQVNGIDHNPANIGFCQVLSSLLEIPAEFKVREFSEPFCNTLS